MNKNTFFWLLVISLTSVSGSFAQNSAPKIAPNQPLIMVFSNGDWRWVRGVQREGTMFYFYELSGRHVKTERFVSVPADRVNTEAFAAVNGAFMYLSRACEAGSARFVEPKVDERYATIFEQAARDATYVGENGQELTGCYEELQRGRTLRRIRAIEAQRTPTPIPTPWPTPSREQIEAAQAEFRARQAEAFQKSQPSYGSESPTATRPQSEVREGEARVIHEQCRAEWPDDFMMQSWCKEQQESAANELRTRGGFDGGVGSRAFRTIRDRCREEWPEDFMMQNWCEERQIEGYKSFNQ